MAVNKVVYDAKVLIDLTSDTVTPGTLASGVTAHDKSGAKITGTMQGVNCKIYRVNVPTALAAQDVTVVKGDPDVAAHYTDADAMVTVRKITNYDVNGITWMMQTNLLTPLQCGLYGNYNAGGGTQGGAKIDPNITNLIYGETSTSTPYIKCNASGDIIVHPQRTYNNFGGADYIITFSW